MALDGIDSRAATWMEAQEHRMSSAALILENKAGEAFIVKAKYKPYWTFPGGIVDAGETPRQTAIRETFDETNIQVVAEAVQFDSVVVRKSDLAITYQFIFRAPLPVAALEAVVLEVAEIAEYALVSKSEVVSGTDKVYSKALHAWASGTAGYIEQQFEHNG
jgi:8-oxo-dGTP diphosphatase